jgi:serine/threonine protein kinase
METIHRDLKPENLVLDERGYVRVTDFGISRSFAAQNGRDTSGTPGYMAPEVILRRNHSYSVDFYALGVVAYEFMTGKVTF